jgi:hypothetical protein
MGQALTLPMIVAGLLLILWRAPGPRAGVTPLARSSWRGSRPRAPPARRVHGRVPAPSAARLLRDARPAGARRATSPPRPRSARCSANAWASASRRPGSTRGAAAVVLAELGPGRGTLMADVLRATRRVPGFHDALSCTSWRPRPRCGPSRPGACRRHLARPRGGAPEAPLFLLANEFFDALPIRQFVRTAFCGPSASWARGTGARLGSAARPSRSGPRLPTRGTATVSRPARLSRHHGRGRAPGRPDWRARWWWTTATGILTATPSSRAPPRLADPLGPPGEADLPMWTSSAAHAAAPPALADDTQGALLGRWESAARRGSGARLEGAARQSSAPSARLTSPEEMGSLFKAMAVHPAASPRRPDRAVTDQTLRTRS